MDTASRMAMKAMIENTSTGDLVESLEMLKAELARRDV